MEDRKTKGWPMQWVGAGILGFLGILDTGLPKVRFEPGSGWSLEKAVPTSH